MKNKTIAALLLSFVSLFASSAFAAEKETFSLIHVKDLSTLLSDKAAKVAVYDANNAETRKHDGVIPGAKLLTDYKKYDVAKVLPSDKDTKLVFYCANTKCMASHEAAKRATEAGYKDVAVMSDGIQGWVKAGQPTQKL
ncbi:MAG: rhodanese-like domain-containing protein [Deltaproteobacteria bacterium]|nr:rhodanese-like domain-containing protein [Deltaproteobacteria bacterium]